MATTNDLKNGMVLNLDGQLWQVIWVQHHRPGKGGAVVRTKLKAVESGKTVDKTFNADVKVEVDPLEHVQAVAAHDVALVHAAQADELGTGPGRVFRHHGQDLAEAERALGAFCNAFAVHEASEEQLLRRIDAEVAEAALASEVSTIDAIADKRIIHKNKAARHKSRLARQVKALSPRA